VATRKIGSLAVSVVGLGCNNFGMRVDEKRSGEVSEPRSTPA
jgi:aryl-alcohol dehydrogenase-like predicted oxidoreductase